MEQVKQAVAEAQGKMEVLVLVVETGAYSDGHIGGGRRRRILWWRSELFGTHKVAGGSSFISGHEGCDAIDEQGKHTGQSIHYSNKSFTNTLMIDGAGYKWTNTKQGLYNMPSKIKGEVYTSAKGSTGDGYARISLISADLVNFPIKNIITSKGKLSKAFTPDNTTYYVELRTRRIQLRHITRNAR